MTTVATVTVMRGEVEHLAALLPTLSWADERHVIETAPDAADTQSVVSGQACLHHTPLSLGRTFDEARGTALRHVATEWVLVVDTDERIPPELVRTLMHHAPQWMREGVGGVWVPRLNHVLGRPLSHSSAWPDYQLRFLRPSAATFTPTMHSYTDVDGSTVKLPPERRYAIRHHNFRSTTQFVNKLNLYASIEADQREPYTRSGLTPALLSGAREFLARYVKMKGYRDGWAGLHYCLLMGMYRYLIGAKLWEKQQALAEPSRCSDRQLLGPERSSS